MTQNERDILQSIICDRNSIIVLYEKNKTDIAHPVTPEEKEKYRRRLYRYEEEIQQYIDSVNVTPAEEETYIYSRYGLFADIEKIMEG